MKSVTLVAVAGLPMKIVEPFTKGLVGEHRNLRLLAAPPLYSATGYSIDYLEELYARVAEGLRGAPEAVIQKRWNLSFVLFFLDKNDSGTESLIERFGLEALLIPLNLDRLPRRPTVQHQVNRSVNELLHDARRQLHATQQILFTVREEVTTRDNRTCMLLPRANYGTDFESVSDFVQGAVAGGADNEGFRAGLKKIERQLPKDSKGYFKGKGGLVYRAPAKAGARHGIAPDWDVGSHTDRCVIRGHLRFGAAFEPNIHYDCKLRSGASRQFVSCHGQEKLKRGRSHVNIALNDNIR